MYQTLNLFSVSSHLYRSSQLHPNATSSSLLPQTQALSTLPGSVPDDAILGCTHMSLDLPSPHQPIFSFDHQVYTLFFLWFTYQQVLGNLLLAHPGHTTQPPRPLHYQHHLDSLWSTSALNSVLLFLTHIETPKIILTHFIINSYNHLTWGARGPQVSLS